MIRSKRRLAAAGRADKDDELVVCDLEVEIGNHGEIAVALDEVADRDRGHQRQSSASTGLISSPFGKAREILRQARKAELAVDQDAVFVLVAAQQCDVRLEIADRKIEGADHVEILAAEHLAFLDGPGRGVLADQHQRAARQHQLDAEIARGMRAGAFHDQRKALRGIADRMRLRAERLRDLQPRRVRIGDVDVADSRASRSASTTPSPTGPAPMTSTGPASLRRHHAADEADRVRRGADRVEQQRRQAVLDVVGHRQQAVFRHRQIFGIAARPVPADQAGDFEAHLGVAARAGGAVVAMQRDVDGAAAAVQAMAGLLDDAEDLVARGEFRALVPELEVRAAQRRARDAHQHFARADFGNRDALDGDAFVAVEYGGLHDRIG